MQHTCQMTKDTVEFTIGKTTSDQLAAQVNDMQIQTRTMLASPCETLDAACNNSIDGSIDGVVGHLHLEKQLQASAFCLVENTH